MTYCSPGVSCGDTKLADGSVGSPAWATLAVNTKPASTVPSMIFEAPCNRIVHPLITKAEEKQAGMTAFPHGIIPLSPSPIDVNFTLGLRRLRPKWTSRTPADAPERLPATHWRHRPPP